MGWHGRGMGYGPCYHQACDNLGNLDRVALDRNLDAMAWSVGMYAYSTEEINGVPPRPQRLKMRNQAKNKIKIAPGLRAHQQGGLTVRLISLTVTTGPSRSS